jgi:hypothetical protein
LLDEHLQIFGRAAVGADQRRTKLVHAREIAKWGPLIKAAGISVD